MKKSLSTIALTVVLASSAVWAEETEYPKNPVLRPLTLTDGTIEVFGALAIGEENDDERGEIALNAAYGLTDDLTLGLGGINYRILARENNSTGLELAVAAGFRGYHDSIHNGDTVAYGVDLNGKYVLDENLAITFAMGYVKWDEDILKNKDEYRYSVGLQTNLSKKWALGATYTYRDLKDFTQNEANEVSTSLNYAYSDSTDIGVFAAYSDFDAIENGYKLDDSFDKVAGIYVKYRF